MGIHLIPERRDEFEFSLPFMREGKRKGSKPYGDFLYDMKIVFSKYTIAIKLSYLSIHGNVSI